MSKRVVFILFTFLISFPSLSFSLNTNKFEMIKLKLKATEFKEERQQLIDITPEIFPELLAILVEPEDEIQIIRVLSVISGANGDRKVFLPQIKGLLTSGDKRIRISAVQCLGGIGSVDECNYAIDMFEKDEDKFCRVNAVVTASKICDEKQVGHISNIIEEKKKSNTKEDITKDPSIREGEVALRDLKRRIKKEEMLEEKSLEKKKKLLNEIRRSVKEELNKTEYVTRKENLKKELFDLDKYEQELNEK